MKKAIFAAALAAVTMPAFAQTAVCTGGDAGDASVTGGTNFIKNTFTQKCSANVYLSYEENATVAAVGAASKKGKNSFAGSTAGGAVAKSAECPSSGCVADTATTAAGTAFDAAAGSSS